MIAFLLKGIVLGFTAAAQPGPFQAYLLSQVTQHGWRKTLPATLAPLISDGPIVALMLFALRDVPHSVLAGIRIAGGAFILYLAYFAVRSYLPSQAAEDQPAPSTSNAIEPSEAKPNRGIWHSSLMNLLNPNPYIFWGTVGAPIVLDGWRISPGHAYAFMLGMYGLLIGGLALFVVIFGKLGALSPKANRWLNGISALALTAFGAWQIYVGANSILS